MRNVLGRHLGDVGVGKPETVEFGQHVAKGLEGVIIVHVVEDAGRRKPDSDSVCTPDADHRLGDFQCQTRPVLHGSAVPVTAHIRSCA